MHLRRLATAYLLKEGKLAGQGWSRPGGPATEAMWSSLRGPSFRACNQRAFAASSKVALPVSARAAFSEMGVARIPP